jgi:hypothetical protein
MKIKIANMCTLLTCKEYTEKLNEKHVSFHYRLCAGCTLYVESAIGYSCMYELQWSMFFPYC